MPEIAQRELLTEPGNAGLRVGLVNMPFTSALSPSIQLGLLQAILSSRGFHAKSIYCNLQLAAELGWNTYEHLANDRTLLLGEWLFSHAAFAGDRRLHFPLLADFEPKGAVARKYGVYREADGFTERALFVLDAAGVIRWSFVSPVGVNPGADGIFDALEALTEKERGL